MQLLDLFNRLNPRWKLLIILVCAALNLALLVHLTKPVTSSGDMAPEDLDPRYLGRVRLQGSSAGGGEVVDGNSQRRHKFVLQMDAQSEDPGPVLDSGNQRETGSEAETGSEEAEYAGSAQQLSGTAYDSDDNTTAQESPNITESTLENQDETTELEEMNNKTPSPTIEAQLPLNQRSRTSAGTNLDFEFLINPSTACQESRDAASDAYLVIGVCSAVHRVHFRSAIRDTWGGGVVHQHSRFGVRILFFVGVPEDAHVQYQDAIRNESRDFGDIVQINRVDNTKNLSFKTLAFLQWVETFCKNAKFVMKTDDDIFVNFRDLFNTLSDLAEENRPKVMMGHLIQGARPIADRNDPWYHPAERLNHRTYPDYLSGSAYLFPRSLVPQLLSSAQRTPVFWLEDIYITGMLARAARASLVHNARFLYLKPEKPYNLCRVSRHVLVLHGVSTDEMHQFWKAINNVNC